jgi:hypothetical protein
VTEGPKTIVISLTVVTDDQSEAVKAHEAMSRAAVGLALDGISATVTAGIPDEDGEL